MTFSKQLKDFCEREDIQQEYKFESTAECTIDKLRQFDMDLGGAKLLVLSGYDGDAVRVFLASDAMLDMQDSFEVRFDDGKRNMDIAVCRKNGATEASAKESVAIFVELPAAYIGKVELKANAQTVALCNLTCDDIEMDVRTEGVLLNAVTGSVEINCNLDMHVECRSLQGQIAINQVSATSKISVPEGTVFSAVTKGIGTSVTFEKNGKPTGAFDAPNADNVIALNGMKSELIISMP